MKFKGRQNDLAARAQPPKEFMLFIRDLVCAICDKRYLLTARLDNYPGDGKKEFGPAKTKR